MILSELHWMPFFGLLITGILNLAVMAIVASFFYIFGIEEPKHLYEHIIQFIWFVLAPQVCCTLIRQNEDEVTEPFKVLRLILNFILSPAVIIYTIILFTYIPGISAKSIGLSCQKQRLAQLISEMKLTDPKTGKLNDEIEDMRRIRQDKKTVLEYPINPMIRKDTMLLHHPEQLLTYRNDSLMLVLEGISINDTIVTDVKYNGLQLFRKSN